MKIEEIIGERWMPLHAQAEACGKRMVAQRMVLPIAAGFSLRGIVRYPIKIVKIHYPQMTQIAQIGLMANSCLAMGCDADLLAHIENRAA
mgnify:CR=1 FL=1